MPRLARKPSFRGAASNVVDWVTLGVLGVATLALALSSRRAPDAERRASRSAEPLEAMSEPGRGRQARTPRQIPARGWSDILKRTVKEFRDDHVALVAAGMTFYALLAFFPGLTAFVALYGLFADVADARRQLEALAGVLPPDTVRFIGDEMIRVASARTSGLTWTFAVGLLVALWSANGAAKACFLGLNIAYEETEKRGFVRLTVTTLAFTLGVLAFVVLTLAVNLSPAWGWLRWPALAACVAGGVALLYRYGPSRDPAQWRWVSWGAGLTTGAWIMGSIGFSLYLSRFAHYDRAYGPLGAVIGFMMWTYVSSLILLAGAELNAELEHQTARDTTSGPALPLGARGASMADTVGAAQ
ncbi:YihY/virulence factor BrkB family protein [uncultured Caulobacter sp.]|uniref:YihY/virulence factor BrkB family protein n=1 Tax=uncultured Caulobacter sp. TaxID=158749 RepID=UPI002622E0F4|nr:YihY/virulence factor BrkB family protein [uncultured Caulobacter sp.]